MQRGPEKVAFILTPDLALHEDAYPSVGRDYLPNYLSDRQRFEAVKGLTLGKTTSLIFRGIYIS